MPLKPFRFNLSMDGSGFVAKEIPAGYKFVTVLNNTDNRIEVYDEIRVDSEPNQALFTVPAYQAISYPISIGIEYTFYYHDGGGVGSKKTEILFTEDNLNMNTSLGGSGGVITSINILTDGVGLTREAQLPAALTASGRLKVELPDNTPVAIAGSVEVTNDAGNPLPVTMTVAIPAGDNNIGNVDVVTLPSLPAGTNNIGDVDVLSLPALPAGTNNIGDVDVLTLPPLPAGTNNIGDVDVLTLPALPTGTNTIGSVNRAGSSWNNFNAANAGVAIKASAGTLEKVVVGTGATTSTLSLYNHASSATNPIAVIDLTDKGVLDFGLSFSTGLFAVITGTADITIIWR